MEITEEQRDQLRNELHMIDPSEFAQTEDPEATVTVDYDAVTRAVERVIKRW